MNKIKFQYPPFYIPYRSFPSEKSLDLKVNFKEKGYLISVDVEATIYSDSPPPEYRGEYLIKGFSFTVEEKPNKKGTLSELAENPNKYPELLSLLASFINVVLNKIRNFGMIPYINEIDYKKYDAKSYFEQWKVEIFTPDIGWRKIIAISETFKEYFFLFWPQFFEESKSFPLLIEADKWEDIKFAIQAKRKPTPEQEFMVNAIELMRLSNWRSALLESITCLEIVLSQFLREYFKYNKVPPNRISQFFKPPGIGLTARISVLLNLTLSPGDLSIINIDEILKAIEWRNTILHRTGHLPEENPEKVKKKIWNVLELADILSLRRDQIKESPEMKKISEEIAKEYNIPVPKIWLFKNHNILMEFVFFSIDCFPKFSILKELIKSISDHLLNRDRLFDANKHLYINFIKFPREIVERWHQGKYELIQKKLSKN